MTFTVKPGEVIYRGTTDGIEFEFTVFVPNNDSCECWIITLKSLEGTQNCILSVGEDLAFLNMAHKPKAAATSGDLTLKPEGGACVAFSDHSFEGQQIYAFFGLKNGNTTTEEYNETDSAGQPLTYTKVDISKEITLSAEKTTFFAVSGAAFDEEQCRILLKKYQDVNSVKTEKEAVEFRNNVPGHSQTPPFISMPRHFWLRQDANAEVMTMHWICYNAFCPPMKTAAMPDAPWNPIVSETFTSELPTPATG